MAVRVETIRDLFENKQWASCAENAAMALAEGEKDKVERAALNFYRSVSLRRLSQFSEALEPGRLALYLADELTDTDRIGRALLNLGWILHKIPGMELSAVEIQRRFLDNFPVFTTLRDEYLSAMVNLGVYLRGAGRNEEAFEQFKATFKAARQRGEETTAQVARTAAVWEALRLRQVSAAEALIKEGQHLAKGRTELTAAHLLDLAQLSMVKNNPGSAAGYVLAAMPIIENVNKSEPSLFPNALVILEQAGEHLGVPEVGLVLGILAKEAAEANDRHDFAAQAVDAIRSIALQYPDAVSRVMATLDDGT